MIPLPELKELANALTRTAEYTQMIERRKKVMANAALGRQMLSYEREHARIANLNQPAADTSAHLKKLYQNYKGLLAHQDVRDFISATHRYQRLISECIVQLNRLLDIKNRS